MIKRIIECDRCHESMGPAPDDDVEGKSPLVSVVGQFLPKELTRSLDHVCDTCEPLIMAALRQVFGIEPVKQPRNSDAARLKVEASRLEQDILTHGSTEWTASLGGLRATLKIPPGPITNLRIRADKAQAYLDGLMALLLVAEETERQRHNKSIEPEPIQEGSP